jgi:thiol-disulfide isomerase/thioredoxin
MVHKESMVHFSIALSSFLINPRRLSYFCVVGTVKTGFSSSEDKGSVKLLLLLLFNALLLLLLLMLFFLSSTHPFNGLESSVMDKPNVPATIPPIKKGKFSDMTSKMSSFSLLLLLLLLFEDAIRPKVVVYTERCGVCLFLSRTFAPLAKDDDEKEEEEDDVVANVAVVVVVVVLIVRAVSILFFCRENL